MREIIRGIFIDFEGGDKSGKTTQVDNLEKHLKEKGFDVVRTKEPGGGDPLIREKLLYPDHPLSGEEQLALFCEDRCLDVKNNILPAIKAKKIIICDRFEPSSIAYQGGGEGLSAELIREESKKSRQGVWPDLILLFDIAPEVAFQRGNPETFFEKRDMAYQTRVRESFLAQAEKELGPWRIIKAGVSKEKVWHQVKKSVYAFFLSKLDIEL